jgi:flagellin
MSVINTNVNSLVAQNAVNVNARSLSKAMEQLSTGKRINGAKDDAAGMSISQIMTAQIRGLNMAVRNANDGISLLQTADGAMVEQTNMMQRMRELAVQAASDTTTASQKGYLQDEFKSLRAEIDRIGANTKWNDRALLDGSGGIAGNVATAGSYRFQVGTSAGTTNNIDVAVPNATSATGGIFVAIKDDNISVDAGLAITNLDTALAAGNSARSKIGAAVNQLTYAADNLSNISMNTSASRSRIEDTDYAQASTELARTQIIQQAATAMLAQANQSPQSVLALLK